MKKIAGVKKVNKGRMQELREEVGVKESLRRKPARSWLKWAHGANGRGTVKVNKES